MPLILRNKTDQNSELAVWKITESVDQLLDLLKQQGIYADIPFFRNPGRLAEWLTARILLATLHIKQKIIYNELGKPFLDGEHVNVSISHSGPYVAVIVSPTALVGVDIEKTGDRIHRVSHKFVNDAELQWIKEPNLTEQLYIIWGAKECAFKIYSLGEIDFRDHLEVAPFEFNEQGITRVHFKKGDRDCIYQVFFQYLDQVMITYAFGA